MKITKSALQRIIREEVAKTLPMPNPERDRRQAAEKDFFGSDDPLITKAEPVNPVRTPSATIPRPAGPRPARTGTERELNDPDRISITDFPSDLMAKIVESYAEKEGVDIEPEAIGRGLYGVVYRGEDPEYGPVAIKMTISAQEMNAYRNIKKLKDKLSARDPEAGNILPTIYNISVIESPPVVVTPIGRSVIEKESGRPYKIFVMSMELLEAVDPAIRSDIFGTNPAELPEELEQRATPEAQERVKAALARLDSGDYAPAEKEALEAAAAIRNKDIPDRVRAAQNYLNTKNVYSGLKKLLGDEDWEKIIDDIRFTGAKQASEEYRQSSLKEISSEPDLPISDKMVLAPFREVDQLMQILRKTYLDAEAQWHITSLHRIHNEIGRRLPKILEKYVSDEDLLRRIRLLSGQILSKQMAANVKLPQYDPEMVKGSPGLRSQIVVPSELTSQITSDFAKRLKKLEKWDTQYGDVHAGNLMQRPKDSFSASDSEQHGDLVVADVGLFLFGKEGSRSYAKAPAKKQPSGRSRRPATVDPTVVLGGDARLSDFHPSQLERLHRLAGLI